MSRQIIKQPNGRYAVWSTIIDNFVYENITIEEYIEFIISEKTVEIRKEIIEIAEKLENGEKPYYQFTMTYEEAMEKRNEIHGLNSSESM